MFAGDGEPMLNPEIVDIINDAHAFNIDCSFTTNGVHFKQSIVDNCLSKISWVKVSINAGNREAYSNIHRTKEEDFEAVWNNLSYAVKYRNANKNSGSCTLGVQSLILDDNLDTLDELADRAKNTGLDYIVLKPYVHNIYMKQEGYKDIDYRKKNYNDVLLGMKQKYNSEDFKVISRNNALDKLMGKSERYKTCWSTPALWFYISGDGSVYSCGAHVGNPNFFLGNINNEDMQDIWQSDQRRNCLDYVQDKLDLDDCRRTCRMDEVNNYLSKVIDERDDHVNFI